jgi:ribosomal protein S18 acetylase RimI-like enzyme
MTRTVIEDYDQESFDQALWIWRRGVERVVEVIDSDPSIEGLRNWVESEVLPAHRLRVAKVSNEVVGVLASNSESVCALYIRADHQHKGIGSALLELAKKDAAGSLWLFTFAKNTRARSFYAKHGFIEIAFGFESHWQLEDVKLTWTLSTNVA